MLRASCFAVFDTIPFGICLVSVNDELAEVKFVSRSDCDNAAPPPSGILQQAYTQLTEYFSGIRTVFSLPLHLCGTSFECTVWHELQKIPYGTVITYGKLAVCAGVKGGSRAVGTACHKNPLPIIVPCHRVIGRNGALTGFGGGLEVKRFLLAHERCRDLPINDL